MSTSTCKRGTLIKVENVSWKRISIINLNHYQIARLELEPTRVEDFTHRLVALCRNITQSWKILPRPKTLAYFKVGLVTAREKKFNKLDIRRTGGHPPTVTRTRYSSPLNLIEKFYFLLLCGNYYSSAVGEVLFSV